jgi:hypothetical protein
MTKLLLTVVLISCFPAFLISPSLLAQDRIVRDGNGKIIARIQGDAWNVTVKTRRTYFHADSLVHSTATVAGGKASARVIGASTGIATTIVTHGAVAPSVLPGIFANIADWFENLFR